MAESLDPWFAPDEWVRVSTGIYLPRKIEVEAVRHPSLPDATVGMTAVWVDDERSYDVVNFQMTREAGVTSAVLRQMPVQTLLRSIVRERAREFDPATGGPRPVVFDRARMKQLAADGPRNPETLHEVGRVYALAEAVLEPPTAAVADTFEIPGRTASHWVKLARERSSLGLVERAEGRDASWPQ